LYIIPIFFFIYLTIPPIGGRPWFWIKQTANSTQPWLRTIYIYRYWRVERYWLAAEVYCIRTYLNFPRLSEMWGWCGIWSAVVRISIPFILSAAVIVFGQIVTDIIYLFIFMFFFQSLSEKILKVLGISITIIIIIHDDSPSTFKLFSSVIMQIFKIWFLEFLNTLRILYSVKIQISIYQNTTPLFFYIKII
jgi:hypothetical protein